MVCLLGQVTTEEIISRLMAVLGARKSICIASDGDMKDLLRSRFSGVIFGETQFTQRPIPSEKEEAMRKSTKFVALDIHKDSITVALAGEGRKGPDLYGTIPSTGAALSKLAGQLASGGTSLRFCYEAGPCGYGVYRQLTALGHACTVVAPSLIPRQPGDRIKTDRRDALSLAALRGVDTFTAVTTLAELGDLTRFDSPRQLMAFVGLVPSEHSSGSRQKRGAITKAGNAHVRRVLVEAAWCYRFPARKTAALQRRAEQTAPAIQAIAWKAQKRLCGRYQRLSGRGMPKNKVCTAIARELLGFIWAIAWEQKRPGSLVARRPRVAA